MQLNYLAHHKQLFLNDLILPILQFGQLEYTQIVQKSKMEKSQKLTTEKRLLNFSLQIR